MFAMPHFLGTIRSRAVAVAHYGITTTIKGPRLGGMRQGCGKTEKCQDGKRTMPHV